VDRAWRRGVDPTPHGRAIAVPDIDVPVVAAARAAAPVAVRLAGDRADRRRPERCGRGVHGQVHASTSQAPSGALTAASTGGSDGGRGAGRAGNGAGGGASGGGTVQVTVMFAADPVFPVITAPPAALLARARGERSLLRRCPPRVPGHPPGRCTCLPASPPPVPPGRGSGRGAPGAHRAGDRTGHVPVRLASRPPCWTAARCSAISSAVNRAHVSGSVNTANVLF
jgi:hypothetical protein